MKELKIDSLDELKSVAEAVIESLNGRNVVAFCGAMGAGKTAADAIDKQLSERK